VIGTRRFRSRSLDRPEESDPELESELEPESEPELEDESDSESESEEVDERRAFLVSLSFSFSFPFSRALAFSSKILFAVPSFFLNSSGTSTEGLPAALSLARTLGFSSCSVREGLET